ncbi:helix-turn-helix domain-containing protein, partial [Streptococcus agalactiae]|uniref:helix-turn-helix domain-containing protein n=1 Tax=Streptococcus agalactiae TaxID=1311 RepID=UPI0022EB757A
MTKHKHLTLSDRNDIQSGLDRGETFKAIGLNLLKHPTTIAKEVKRNKQLRESTKDCLDCPLLRKAPYVCNGVKKGQRIYHILKTNDLEVSSSTVYRHIKKGYLSITPIDLPRAV